MKQSAKKSPAKQPKPITRTKPAQPAPLSLSLKALQPLSRSTDRPPAPHPTPLPRRTLRPVSPFIRPAKRKSLAELTAGLRYTIV